MKKKLLIKIIKAIYFAVVSVTVALAVVVSLTVFGFGDNVKFASVQSGSMDPTIKPGSVVLINKHDSYNSGEIISFLVNDGTSTFSTTHRIVSQINIEGEKYFLTKGDNNDDVDGGLLKAENILGKVIFTVPYLGMVVNFTRTKLGFLLLIAIPAVAIVYGEIISIGKNLMKLKKRRKVYI